MSTGSSKYLLDTSREYSMYVGSTRAIPHAADGLKDSQRKALWVLRNRAEKTKTISVAGEMISSGLYLHGDQAAASMISMLAAPYCNNVPYLEGIGTFGTRIAPTDWAAPRYTYVKKYKLTEALMYPDLDIVPLRDNYDGSTKEPVHFLPLIPTTLLNGVSGIAVGWSTSILPRSVSTLIDATIAALDGKKLPDLMPEYTCFSGTKCVKVNDGVYEFYGNLEIEDTSTIRITELPPDMTPAAFRDKLDTMEEDGDIVSYADNSTDLINILVKFKRGSLKEWTVDKAIDFFKLKQRKSERMVVIDWGGGYIRQYPSPEEFVADFVEWRLGWFATRYTKYLNDALTDLNFHTGFKTCYDAQIPKEATTCASPTKLNTKIDDVTDGTLTKDQVSKIAATPIYGWTEERYAKTLARIDELNTQIAEYEDLLNSPKKLKAIYRKELGMLKKMVA